MLFGLGLGLTVAVFVYLDGRSTDGTPVSVTVSPPTSGVPPGSIVPGPGTAETPQPATRFDFYEILPKFEVVLPETELEARPDVVETALEEPGRYVLQAGSFSAEADAERMRANLALLGIESRIQRVTIDTDDYHRVRIGPSSDLEALNGTRARLRDAQIEVLLIKLSN